MMAVAAMRGAKKMGFSILLKDASTWFYEPATFRLLDEQLYLVRYSLPKHANNLNQNGAHRKNYPAKHQLALSLVFKILYH